MCDGVCRWIVCYLANTFIKSIAETVKSRSPTLQLHTEVSNVCHVLFTSINSQSKHIHRMYNESIVRLTCITSFAMRLAISSYVFDENMMSFNLIYSSILEIKKQIRKQKYKVIVSFYDCASINRMDYSHGRWAFVLNIYSYWLNTKYVSRILFNLIDSSILKSKNRTKNENIWWL